VGEVGAHEVLKIGCRAAANRAGAAGGWPPSFSVRWATSLGSPTRHHFAAHTGTAPLKASSGQVVRHRLSRAGDRKLNQALYMMAMAQIRHATAGQAYYRRKRAETSRPRKPFGA
jgi:hypothetical protein